MSLSPVIEEYIYELSKSIGDSYNAVVNGIGKETIPSTALFELTNISDIASRNLPRFGILKSSPQGFLISPTPNTPKFIRVGTGQIGYNGSRITVPTQLVPISRVFSNTYDSSYVYGVKIGFPLSEAIKSTQTFNTTLKQSAQAGDTVLYLNDLSIPISLGFPLKAYIETEFVVIQSLNQTNDGVVIDSSTGGLQSYKSINSNINFIYQPRVSAICGLPVSSVYQSSKNPEDFSYYPPMPFDWLSIADVLVENPNNPQLTHSKPVLANVRLASTPLDSIVFGSYDNNTQILSTGSACTKIDSVGMSTGDRILIKDLTSSYGVYNGVYNYGGTNAGITTFKRVSDLNDSTEFIYGIGIGVTDGLVNKGLEFSYQGVSSPIISPPTTNLPFSNITIDSFAVQNTVVEFPTSDTNSPLFSNSDAKQIISSVNSTKTQLQQLKLESGVGDIIRAFELYTNTISDNPQQTFNEFWSSQPFKPKKQFVLGLTADNMTRLEFPISFAQAFYNTTGSDVQHTFAIFRGDLYNSTSVYNVNLSAPTGFILNSYNSKSVTSTLSNGTYSYGITALNNNGESVTNYSTVDLNSNDYSLVELKSTDVEGALYYNVYRKSTLVAEQVEYQLNNNKSISSFMVPTDTTGIGSFSINQIIGVNTYYAIKTLITEGTMVGGVGLKLKLNYSSPNITLNNSGDYISVFLYNGAGNTATTLVATGSNIYYRDITNSYQEFISRFDNSINLTLNSNYYLVLKTSNDPYTSDSGSISLNLNLSTVTTNTTAIGIFTATTSSFPTFTNNSDNAAYLKFYGFLDNGIIGKNTTKRGVKLMNTTSVVPRKLSVYAPNVIAPDSLTFSGNIVTVGNGNGDNVQTPATTPTQNELNVTIVARNGENGIPVTLTATVPKNTPRNTRINVSPDGILVDRVDDVYVTPSTNPSNLSIGSNGQIDWSFYDFITIETLP